MINIVWENVIFLRAPFRKVGIKNMDTCWGIHAGKTGDADSLFLNKKDSCVAIGWDEMGDLSKIPDDREIFKKKLVEAYPTTKKGAINTVAGMPYRFKYEMQIGDYVVYPSIADRMVHIGRIIGNYQYKPEISQSYCNMRPVEWIKAVPRTNISQGALYEIGSALSLFQVKNYVDDILKYLDSNIVDINPQSIVDDEDDTIDDVFANIESTTSDFIFKKLFTELKGFTFEPFVAHILNIIGYNTRVTKKSGDGGIDIIAFKDELGIEPPIIKVQVKCVEGAIGAPAVQALYGNVENGEYGLFITLGDFTKQAGDFAKNKTNLRLMDGQELVNLILKNYEKLDSKYKAIIPLKNVYIPTQIENY